MQWIDVHVHVGEDAGGVSATENDVFQLFEDGHLDGAVVFCFNEVGGIDRGNQRIRELVSGDDRMAGLFRVDPAVHDEDDLKRAVNEGVVRSHRSPNDVQTGSFGGFCGFKLHPRSQDFSMQHAYEHMQVIGELDVPALIHTGVGDDPSTGFTRAHPEEILEAAEIHRHTDVILAHNTKGYYFHAPDDFKQRLRSLENVYIDISLHCTPLGVETLVDELGAKKLLFASDFPYGHPVPMQKNIAYADIAEEAAEHIAWRNTEELFFSRG